MIHINGPKSGRRTGRVVGLAMAALASAGAVSIASTAPANATIAQCRNEANGFAETPANVAGARTVRSVGLGRGVSVELRTGTYAGGQRGWARLTGNDNNSDAYWMDWTTNGGSSWIQCGPFTGANNGGRNFTPGQRTNASTAWRFRACGRINPPDTTSICTPWW